jgi:hypothetical protein
MWFIPLYGNCASTAIYLSELQLIVGRKLFNAFTYALTERPDGNNQGFF